MLRLLQGALILSSASLATIASAQATLPLMTSPLDLAGAATASIEVDRLYSQNGRGWYHAPAPTVAQVTRVCGQDTVSSQQRCSRMREDALTRLNQVCQINTRSAQRICDRSWKAIYDGYAVLQQRRAAEAASVGNQ